MPTTYTSSIRLTNQEKGSNAQTWGDIADLNFEFIDDAINGKVDVDITGASSYTLTVANGLADEARHALIKIIGTPASQNSIIIPDVEKIYAVHAAHTSIAGGILIRNAAGTGVAFRSGDRGLIYCDGVSVWNIADYSQDALRASNNLSDLTDTCAAINNLGLDYLTSVTALGSGFSITSGVLDLSYANIMDRMYPIGSIYMNRTDSTNPGTLLGFGTWNAVTGRVPVGVGAGIDSNGVSVFTSALTCGGEYLHTLTTAELTDHGHSWVARLHTDDNVFVSGGIALANPNLGTATTYPANPGAAAESPNGQQIGGEGSSQPFNVRNPYYSVYMWQRVA